MSKDEMTPSEESLPSQFIPHGFRFSLVLHTALIFWLGASWIIDEVWPTSEQEKIKLRNSLSKKTIRVDIVDLPSVKMQDLNKIDLTKEVEVKAAPKEESKKEAAKKEEVIAPSPTAMKFPSDKKELSKPNSKKSRLEEIQQSIRAEAKREELLAKFKKDLNSKEAASSDEKRVALGGNILSKGGSVQGDIANEANEFTALIQTHVQKFWKSPPWSVGQDLKTRILVKLSPTGRVLSKQIIRSSGRGEFDRSAIEAIEAADPFPNPPEFLKRLILQEGIECGFPD